MYCTVIIFILYNFLRGREMKSTIILSYRRRRWYFVIYQFKETYWWINFNYTLTKMCIKSAPYLYKKCIMCNLYMIKSCRHKCLVGYFSILFVSKNKMNTYLGLRTLVLCGECLAKNTTCCLFVNHNWWLFRF